LQQSVNVEKEFSHNNRGNAPSNFANTEIEGWRAVNRGAILANIFERYTITDLTGASKLNARDFKLMLGEMASYLKGLTTKEAADARKEMRVHLLKRGFKPK